MALSHRTLSAGRISWNYRANARLFWSNSNIRKWKFGILIYRLREAGCKVTVIGPAAGQSYPSKLGYPVKSDKAAEDVTADNFDLIVVPGGFAPDFIRRSTPMVRLVSDMAEKGKIVAAICHGPWVLCSTAGAQRPQGDLLFRHQGRCDKRGRPLPRCRSGA